MLGKILYFLLIVQLLFLQIKIFTLILDEGTNGKFVVNSPKIHLGVVKMIMQN